MALFDLTGKVALITGAGGGLGYFITKALASAGATVVLNGRNEAKLENVVHELSMHGYKAYGYAFDITDSDTISNAIQRIKSEVGNIDILVNNAGVQHRKALEDFPDNEWQEILDINLTGTFKVSKAVVKGMIRRKSGKIINICSLMSEVGRPTIAPYAASKGGLKMLTKSMAVEWAKHNIQVNGIGPGYFITDMTRSLADDKKFNDWIIDRTPAGRWGNPDELAGTIVYLASDASNFVNGQLIYVDGGILAAL